MPAEQDLIQDARTQPQLSWRLPGPRALSTSTELPLVARTPWLFVRRTRIAKPCPAPTAQSYPANSFPSDLSSDTRVIITTSRAKKIQRCAARWPAPAPRAKPPSPAAVL